MPSSGGLVSERTGDVRQLCTASLVYAAHVHPHPLIFFLDK